MTWKKVNGAQGYEVYKDGNLVAKLENPDTLTWSETGLSKDVEVSYKVRAYCLYNNEVIYGSYSSDFVKEVIDLVRGKRMELDNVRQSLMIINEVAAEVKQGRKFMIFPEGGYDKNKRNALWEFKSGCFKASLKSQTPIVPVVLVDTYRAFDISYLGPVRTQVHYLEPIPYEEYKDKKTKEIALLVKERIQAKLDELGV